MRITDLLSKESIRLDGVSSTKKETIRAMADLMEKSGKISDKNAYVEGSSPPLSAVRSRRSISRQSARVSQFLIIKAVR